MNGGFLFEAQAEGMATLFFQHLIGAHGVDGVFDLLHRAAEPLAARLPNAVDAQHRMHVMVGVGDCHLSDDSHLKVGVGQQVVEHLVGEGLEGWVTVICRVT